MTPEHGAKIAAALTGRTLSDDHRAATAAALQGRVMSAEARAKMSASQRRRRAREATCVAKEPGRRAGGQVAV
jgi:hypothetical protein